MPRSRDLRVLGLFLAEKESHPCFELDQALEMGRGTAYDSVRLMPKRRKAIIINAVEPGTRVAHLAPPSGSTYTAKAS